MAMRSKKVGERLRKAAKQREKKRLMKMTPRERWRLKRERMEINNRLNETEEQRLDRDSREVLAGCLIAIILLILVVCLVIRLLNYIVANSG